MTYRIVITGSNCEKYAARSILSAMNQRAPKGQAVTVHVGVDGGTDDTFRIANRSGADVHAWSENRGAAYARHRVLTEIGANPDDVIALLDMDDHLANDRVIQRVAKEYEAGADCTYGSYEFETGGSWVQEPYPEGCDYRTHPWRCAPLRTFRYELFDPDPERYRMNGAWIRKATDLALMFPVLEASVKPVHIKDVLYIYNHDHAGVSRFSVSKEYRKEVESWIRSR